MTIKGRKLRISSINHWPRFAWPTIQAQQPKVSQPGLGVCVYGAIYMRVSSMLNTNILYCAWAQARG